MKRRPTQIAAGVLAASCFAAVVQMLTLDELDRWQHFAVAGFTVSIPINAFAFLCPIIDHPGPNLPWRVMASIGLRPLGQLSGTLSIGLALCHFSIGYGVTFTLVSCACFLLFRGLARDFASLIHLDQGEGESD
jgi:hypothetical protein